MLNRQRRILIDRLEASGKEYVGYLAQLEPEVIHAPPAPNEWTIHQIAAHMRDTEQHAFLLRAQRILTEEHPTVQNFDQDEWNREHYSPDEPLKKIMAEFRASRRKLLQLLRRATDKDWANWALHSAFGKLPLDWVAMHSYHHTLEHISQIGYAHEEVILKKLNN